MILIGKSVLILGKLALFILVANTMLVIYHNSETPQGLTTFGIITTWAFFEIVHHYYYQLLFNSKPQNLSTNGIILEKLTTNGAIEKVVKRLSKHKKM